MNINKIKNYFEANGFKIMELSPSYTWVITPQGKSKSFSFRSLKEIEKFVSLNK